MPIGTMRVYMRKDKSGSSHTDGGTDGEIQPGERAASAGNRLDQVPLQVSCRKGNQHGSVHRDYPGLLQYPQADPANPVRPN